MSQYVPAALGCAGACPKAELGLGGVPQESSATRIGPGKSTALASKVV